ncbi:hypothetical protein [Geothrix sp.]|jgi:hypothetical protein|uniref:hypothetical protein n=1 Tax=Geothrix sp. TaxID=1962974 RepID=UPI0025C28B35|nr:hypothetical protein [Geothrix sp.]
MNPSLDWKRFQFITIAQTVILNNAINLSLNEDAKEHRHIFSATGTIILMDQLFHAAENIPSDLTAFEAAHAFCTYFLENLRETEIQAGATVDLPYWCAR